MTFCPAVAPWQRERSAVLNPLEPAIELSRPPARPERAARGPPQRLHEHRELGDEPRKQRLRFDERGLRAGGAQRLRERGLAADRT